MWLAVLLFVCILGLLTYLDTRKPKNFPPGPDWMPIVGSAVSVAMLRRTVGGYLYLTTAELARRYGSVVGLKVGKDKLCVCSGYEAIKEMLTKDDFDGRPQGPFFETRTWGTRRGLLLTDEEFWQEQRRFVLRHLRDFGFGRRTMAGLIEDEALQLVNLFRDKLQFSSEKGVVMELNEVFGVSVLNALWTMLAGIRYNPADRELKRLQSLLTELMASVDMIGTLFSQFPVLRFIAPEMSGYKQFISIHQHIWEFLKAELDKHKATYNADEPRDLMDVYLQMLNSEGKKHDSFTESQLLAICLDMFIAGSETTSKSMGFEFLYLLLHPEVQRKAHEEIDRVVGRNRLPTLNDKMPYIDAIVYETVRVFMGRAFGVPHRALRDTTIQGYDIPKDTMVLANMTSILMDKEFWGDPEVFRPDRFIDSEGNVAVPNQYLPFGFGKHRCLGMTLARSNIFVFTAALLQNFEFSIPPGQAPPSTQGWDGATPYAGTYHALVKYRPLNNQA